METRCITTISELETLAGGVLSSCVKKDTAHVLALSGDLGAGKTAFTKVLGKTLGVAGEITSPTFVIMKSYTIPNHSFFKTLVHIDAYRIESDDEMRVLGFSELLTDETKLICIEWPEKIQSLIPSDAHTVTITLNMDGTREVTF